MAIFHAARSNSRTRIHGAPQPALCWKFNSPECNRKRTKSVWCLLKCLRFTLRLRCFNPWSLVEAVYTFSPHLPRVFWRRRNESSVVHNQNKFNCTWESFWLQSEKASGVVNLFTLRNINYSVGCGLPQYTFVLTQMIQLAERLEIARSSAFHFLVHNCKIEFAKDYANPIDDNLFWF